MKFLIVFSIFLLTNFVSNRNLTGQTFVNSTVAVANSWNATLTRTVTVSGLTSPLGSGNNELVQVNIHMGRQADGTYNYSKYDIALTSPLGTTILIVDGSPGGGTFAFPNSSVREFDSKFRDNQYLQFPTSGSGTSSEPWHIGYYRTTLADSFSAFNNEDPNGIWTITITENSLSSGARFNEVALLFDLPFSETDYTAYNQNDNCATPFCLRPSDVIIATNNGFTDQASDLFDPNTSGCSWNSAQNASSWFKFIADATNVTITVSGVTASLQILGVSSSNQCSAAATTVLNGGCPEDPINDTYLSPRYTNGSTNNNQLNMSGLTIGETYYFVVDGQGVAISPFYIEITGASNLCSDILPVELLTFQSSCTENGKADISWQTATETNNDYFTLFRSDGANEFTPISIIPGAGNSNTITNYQFTDTSVSFSPAYYRLRQTDFNGDFATIGEEVSTCLMNVTSLNTTLSYDHDAAILTIGFIETGAKPCRLIAFDAMGQLVFVSDYLTEAGQNNLKVNTSDWREGVYLLQLICNGMQNLQKIMIH